jgi:hypothetical protein
MVLTMITPKHDVPRYKQIPARGLRRLTIGRLVESLNQEGLAAVVHVTRFRKYRQL